MKPGQMRGDEADDEKGKKIMKTVEAIQGRIGDGKSSSDSVRDIFANAGNSSR